MRKIAATIGVMAIIALAAYTYHTLKSARYIYSGPTSITVTGEGEVFATPNVASFSFTVNARETEATAAQNKASETMAAVLAYLEEAGVEEKDVKTDYYNLSPRYEYPQTVCTVYGCPPAQEGRLIGYEVSQSVTVKVRDTEKAGEIISQVGSKGAQNVSSISFTIDDEDALMDEARQKAIENAKKKAEMLADSLGARIVRMNGYWEESPSPYYYGKGGGVAMDMAVSAVAPRAAELPLGESTITSRVNISYEIR